MLTLVGAVSGFGSSSDGPDFRRLPDQLPSTYGAHPYWAEVHGYRAL